MMEKEKIIEILRQYKAEVADEYGIIAIGIFGSAAREQANEVSDVDVVVRIVKPDLFLLAGIKDELEQRLGRPVDLITYRERMNRFLRERIDKDAVYA